MFAGIVQIRAAPRTRVCGVSDVRVQVLIPDEVAKLALAWQANALASEGARLTRDLFEETIESQKAQTMLKREWKALERGKKRPKAH